MVYLISSPGTLLDSEQGGGFAFGFYVDMKAQRTEIVQGQCS